MWTWRGLDLVGSLLCGRPGLAGIAFWAVGTGDPAWGDGAPPPPDPAALGLAAEVARGRLRRSDLTISPDGASLTAAVTVAAGTPGPLRELGLFGGDASPRPGSGVIVSLQRFAPVASDAAVTFTVGLSLPAGLLPGARQIIAALLAGTDAPAAARIGWLAVGTGQRTGDPLPPGLGAETTRAALAPGDVVYDQDRRQVVASMQFPFDQALGSLTEAGLFAGDDAGSSSGSGTLVAYDSHAPIDRSVPTALAERFVLSLSTDEAIPVPDLTNQLLADAQSSLSAVGLTVGAATQSTDDQHPRGTVLAQSPAAAATAQPGWRVNVTVSVPTQVVVPPLVGAAAAAVADLLSPVGLVVDEANSTTEEDPAPAGTVLRTVPSAGTTVDRGSGVALVTAIPVTTAVPDLRGQTPDAAAALLAGTGLALSSPPYETEESDLTAGAILSQTPDAGQQATLGSEITPVIATGWTVAVPDLTGMTADDAAAKLADAGAAVLAKLGRPSIPLGLSLGARTTQESTAAPGTILTQFPAAGATASLHGVVDIVVATAPTDVVPDVTGQSQVDAAAAITSAGLIVGPISTRMKGDPTDADDHTVAGTVLDQQPAAGTRWPTGGAVALTVSTPLATEVPSVVGLPLDVAKETLQGRTFTVGALASQASGGAPGSVSAQDPKEGALTPLGSGIALTIVVGVPSLIGLTEDAARAVLDPLGLNFGQIASQPNAAPVGTILAQQPPAGSAANADTVVNITLASPLQVAVPDFSGDTIDAAQATASNAGLVLVVGGTAPSGASPGTIVSQDPPAGALVAPGSSVTVTTAMPVPVQQTVPSLQGMDQPTATQTLAAIGLGLAVTGQVQSPQPALTVVSQAPAAGSQVPPGTVVSVQLAAPPDANTVLVPDVRGTPSATATQTLTSAGLTVTTLTTPSTAAAPGTVLTQAPLPGIRVPTGSAVSITVVAVPTTVVPDVTDLSQSAAQLAITQAGLVARFAALGTGIGIRLVVAQRPVGGTVVPTGTVVSCTVGIEPLPVVTGGGGVKPLIP